MLFHVSEEPGIERFEPRASEYVAEPAVWAIDASTSGTTWSRVNVPG